MRDFCHLYTKIKSNSEEIMLNVLFLPSLDHGGTNKTKNISGYFLRRPCHYIEVVNCDYKVNSKECSKSFGN